MLYLPRPALATHYFHQPRRRHQFFFVRQDSGEVRTSADWKFRQPSAKEFGRGGFSEQDVINSGKVVARPNLFCTNFVQGCPLTPPTPICVVTQVALRQVDAETIGVEIETVFALSTCHRQHHWPYTFFTIFVKI